MKAMSVEFFNQYKLLVDPPVSKTVIGSPSSPSAFTFSLTPDPGNPPGTILPDGSTGNVNYLQITGSGNGDFGLIDYTMSGTFIYTVREVNTGISGYAYDPQVYTIKDIVTLESTGLSLNRTITNESGQEVSVCAFINTYTGDRTVPGSDSPNIMGRASRTFDDMNPTIFILLLLICGTVSTFLVIHLQQVKNVKRQVFSPERERQKVTLKREVM
jgi:pilin isopeptide linkage protein